MKELLKAIRNKIHTDIIIYLQKILDELINNTDIQEKQYKSIEEKIDLLKQDFSIWAKRNSSQELMDRLSSIEDEIINIKKDIYMISQVSKDVKEKLYRNDWEPKQNIKQYLHQIAGMQTAEYIIKNMSKVPAFNVTLDILTYGLSKVSIDGLYLEFGVFSGKTINHIAGIACNNIIYGFDSFEGLPEDWRTGFKEGTFKRGDLPQVKDNVRLIKGWFNETLPKFIKEHNEKCAFIHIDCDLYSSTKCVFDLLKDKIVKGTIIVFDEYFNYPGWQNGEYKALQDFLQENNLSYEYIGYVEIMEQVAIRIL